MKINEYLDTYEKKNTEFNLEKIKLKNDMMYDLNCQIIHLYDTYKKKHGSKVDSYFIMLINNYKKNYVRFIFYSISSVDSKHVSAIVMPNHHKEYIFHVIMEIHGIKHYM